MLTIRSEQMAVFRQLKQDEFEDKTFARLLELRPAECEDLGEAAVRESIRKGVKKAIGYGIDREGEVSRYINIMYPLGHDFDVDPRYRWATDILNDASGAKIDRLCRLTAMVLAKQERKAPLEE
jgi:hypothetical protein